MTTATTSDTPPAPTVLPPALTIAGVRASYGRIEVLHGVDLTVPAGQRLRPPGARTAPGSPPSSTWCAGSCAPPTGR